MYTNLSDLENSIGVSSIEKRMNDLLKKYLMTSLTNKNPLIVSLAKEYKVGFQAINNFTKITPLCCLRELIFSMDI